MTPRARDRKGAKILTPRGGTCHKVVVSLDGQINLPLRKFYTKEGSAMRSADGTMVEEQLSYMIPGRFSRRYIHPSCLPLLSRISIRRLISVNNSQHLVCVCVMLGFTSESPDTHYIVSPLDVVAAAAAAGHAAAADLARGVQLRGPGPYICSLSLVIVPYVGHDKVTGTCDGADNIDVEHTAVHGNQGHTEVVERYLGSAATQYIARVTGIRGKELRREGDSYLGTVRSGGSGADDLAVSEPSIPAIVSRARTLPLTGCVERSRTHH
ncbi:hypothetical protein B566_EDAN007284 [Ephemera danica]|nr:hypothetical protein B566_EDAN007284 [Ephemera danica]